MAVTKRRGDESVVWRGGKLERIGGRFAAGGQLTYRWDRLDDHPIELDITIENGVAAVEAIRVFRASGRSGLTASDVKRLPLPGLLARALKLAAFTYKGQGADGSQRVGPLRESDGEELELVVASASTRRRLTDERIREVAEVYERCEGDVDATAGELYLSRPQTFRLLKRAREAGYLPAKGVG